MTIRRNLISTEELQARIGRPNIRIVDCRFELGEPLAGRTAYLGGHIPTAVYADLDRDLAAPVTPDTGRHPLPKAAVIAKRLGQLGISNTSDVIVYDGGSGAIAARAWWLLRWLGHQEVWLLDGGFQRWVAEDRALMFGDELIEATTFSPDPQDDKVLSTAELARNMDAIEELTLIDARDAARFRGEVEPIDPVAGHVPGTSNLPYTVSLQDDGRWKARADLESLWREVLGNDRGRAWSAMCGSGVTACHLAISALEAGYREPRLYVGSWSEWIRDPARPIEPGKGSQGPPEAADMT